ncbi:MAG: polysaccharide deacetylase [Marivirga sp.]|nr:polysaccharide deacetylase [Marivirga sp.]
MTYDHGAIVRGDLEKKEIALVFTGDTFGDGGEFIATALQKEKVKASFFLTGNFYRNPEFKSIVRTLKKDAHYLGAHSDKHLLYCSWNNRDSLLVTKQEFQSDLDANYNEMKGFGVKRNQAHYFLPPYEWFNDSISTWTRSLGLQLINFSPGTISHADYTTPDMKNYRSSEEIIQSIKRLSDNMNGFILLVHIGTHPARTDKFYKRLPEVLRYLKSLGYRFVKVDELLSE